MKKVIAIFMSVLVLGLLVGSATAEDYDLSTELSINGTGSFDRTLDVQTELGYAGKTLNEDYYTRWMGTDGASALEYNSVLEIYMGNSSEFEDQKVTTIDYAQTAFSSNAKWLICAKNYDIGARQGIEAKGNLMKSVEIGMDDTVNEFDFEGSANGKLRLMQKVVDPVSRVIYLDEDTRFDGRFDVTWYAYAEKISYPEGDEDWLGCP